MKRALIVITLITSISGLAQHHAVYPDKSSVHGMVIFGKDRIYASHLPLFRTPHDYQILLELRLPAKAKLDWLKYQKENPTVVTYTFEPEPFVLPEMIERPRPFKIKIFAGHFERGGTELWRDVSVEIADVLYYRKLESDTFRSTTTDFILVGNKKEQFIIHQLSQKPDFEQILQVFTEIPKTTGKYVIVTINPDQNTAVAVSGNEVNAIFEKQKVKLMLLRQLYLEFEDLK